MQASYTYTPRCGFRKTLSNLSSDVKLSNILLGVGVNDEPVLAEMEQAEISNPSPRKQLGNGRTIYRYHLMPVTEGNPSLSDLGLALVGKEKYAGLVMSADTRAPEVMLGMQWDKKIDIWAVGMMVCPDSSLNSGV